MAEQQKPVRKIPLRECLGCKERLPKAQLLRVVRSPEGEVSLDFTGKKSGRGAYICRKLGCLQKARKAKRLERSLEVSIPEELYDRMEQELAAHEE